MSSTVVLERPHAYSKPRLEIFFPQTVLSSLGWMAKLKATLTFVDFFAGQE